MTYSNNNQTLTKKSSRNNSVIVTLLLSLMYLGSPYRILGVNLPDLMLFLAGILSFFNCVRGNSIKTLIPQSHLFYLLYLLFIPTIATIVSGIPGNFLQTLIPRGVLIYTIWCFSLNENIDYNRILKIFKILCRVVVVVFFIQEFCYLSFGYRPTFYIPFLPMYYDMSMDDFSGSRALMSRSSSLFLEPAHFIEFLFPYFCILLCDTIRKKKISIELVVLLITFLYAKSGCGFIELIVVGTYLYFKKYKANPIFKTIIFLVLIAIITYILNSFSGHPLIEPIMSRLEEFKPEIEAYGAQSGFERIYRGYFVYDTLPTINKVLGLGVGSIEYAFDHCVIYGLRSEVVFMNGAQTVLIGGGVIGSLFFINYMHKFSENFCLVSMCVILAMVGLFFIELMLFNFKMFHYLCIAYCYNLKSQRQYT